MTIEFFLQKLPKFDFWSACLSAHLLTTATRLEAKQGILDIAKLLCYCKGVDTLSYTYKIIA